MGIKVRAHVLDDKDDEIILVLEVLVEGGTSDSRFLAELVDGDVAELHVRQQTIPGHPVCMDVVEEDEFFLVTIDVPGYSGTSKISKKGSS